MKHYLFDNDPQGKDFPFLFGKVVLMSQDFSRHSHDYSELVLITSGSGLHTAENFTYPVRAGDVFVINKNQSHGFSRVHALCMYNIGFRQEVVDILDSLDIPAIRVLLDLEPRTREKSGFTSKLHINPHELENVILLLHQLELELKRKLPGYQLLFSNLFFNLIIMLARYYSESGFLPARNLLRMAAGMARLEKEYNQRFDLGQLAEESGFSLPHFIRSFTAVYGLSPLQYILQLRISRAAELLENTLLPISQIGDQCGFEDSNYFSRVFRKRMGCSPRQYRNHTAT
ncbi:MAG: helix-turn-helix transcriptional regulator [Bacteroidetes bacterium]|nr:helix-turn-helix transcriptional regulator [Bacteroidota bacterium]